MVKKVIRKVKEYSEEISIPIYDENIKVIFTDNIEKSATKLGENITSTDICGLFIYGDDKKSPTILYDNNSSIDVRVHEVCHFCIYMLKSRGINPSDESGEEAFCYLMGFTINKIEEIYQKAKKKLSIK